MMDLGMVFAAELTRYVFLGLLTVRTTQNFGNFVCQTQFDQAFSGLILVSPSSQDLETNCALNGLPRSSPAKIDLISIAPRSSPKFNGNS